MKKTVLIVAVLALVGACFGRLALAQEAKQSLAYLDYEKAVMEVAEGKSSVEKLKSFHADKQAMLDKEMEQLKKMKEDMDKKAAMMTADARAKQEAEFQQRYSEFQSKGMSLQGELDQMKNQALEPIMTKMAGVVQIIAEQEKYDMVLNKAVVLYAPDKLDITAQVIREYDRKFPVTETKPAPAPASATPSKAKAKGGK